MGGGWREGRASSSLGLVRTASCCACVCLFLEKDGRGGCGGRQRMMGAGEKGARTHINLCGRGGPGVCEKRLLGSEI